MFGRKKPQNLLVFEELQNVHMGACNLTFQNLAFEDSGDVDGALKGWKLLHTLILFRIESLEKQQLKFSPEETMLFQELKALRDQNVKHLIRCQLRVEEATRKSNQSTSKFDSRPSPSASSSSMSVPSLRKGAPSRQLNTQPRGMRKSLRPPQGTRNALAESANKAANVLWSQPSSNNGNNSSPSNSGLGTTLYSGIPDSYYLKSVGNMSPIVGEDEFADFDQDWDRIDPGYPMESEFKGLAISDIPTLKPTNSTPLISLSPPKTRKSEEIKPPRRQDDLVRPPARSVSPTRKTKSTLDVRPKYSYSKPKPLNVSGIMRAQAKKSGRPVTSRNVSPPTEAPAPSMGLPVTHPSSVTASSTAQSNSNKPNGSYYKSTTVPKIYIKATPKNKPQKRPESLALEKPDTLKKTSSTTNPSSKEPIKKSPDQESDSTKPEIMSPTMDDLLLGYDKDQQLTATEEDLLLSEIKGIDIVAGKQILNDIVVHGDEVFWTDIAGLEQAKSTLKETVVYPFLRPDLFSGLREPARGLLLFGPPGTGKTMLARAVATELKLTFFSISASLLTSKYLGESEKLVKALFLLARRLAPLIVFIDEIDSLLSQRVEGEVESSRRIKNEFLIQWSELSSAAAGKDTEGDVSRVLILGATNVPWAIDEAARRRFVKRQYIPLPEDATRETHLRHLLSHQKHTMNDEDFTELVNRTQGFSGSDITALTKDAAMGPLRELGDKILTTPRDQIRAVGLPDFVKLMEYIRPSVLTQGIEQHEEWARLYGLWGG